MTKLQPTEDEIYFRLIDINAFLKAEYGYCVTKDSDHMFRYMIEEQLINLTDTITFAVERPGSTELNIRMDIDGFLSDKANDIVCSIIEESAPDIALKRDYICRILKTNAEICKAYFGHGCASCPLTRIGESTGLSTCYSTLRNNTYEYAKVIEFFNKAKFSGGARTVAGRLAQISEEAVKYAKEG